VSGRDRGDAGGPLRASRLRPAQVAEGSPACSAGSPRRRTGWGLSFSRLPPASQTAAEGVLAIRRTAQGRAPSSRRRAPPGPTAPGRRTQFLRSRRCAARDPTPSFCRIDQARRRRKADRSSFVAPGPRRGRRQVTAPAALSSTMRSQSRPSSSRMASPCSLNPGAREVCVGFWSNCTGLATSSNSTPSWVAVRTM
jgi:hypothetical protein